MKLKPNCCIAGHALTTIVPTMRRIRITVNHEASQQAARKKSGRGRYSLATMPDEPKVGDFPPTCNKDR
jgi:hypothetical protein